MMLFIERDFEPVRPNIQVLIDAEISIYFQDEVIREEGLFFVTAPLETGTHVFTTEDNVKSVFISHNLGIKWI
jgi:hypothetical protein